MTPVADVGPPVIDGPDEVQVMVDVPALKVKFEFVPKLTGAKPLNVNVLLPRLIVRVLRLSEDMAVAVIL